MGPRKGGFSIWRTSWGTITEVISEGLVIDIVEHSGDALHCGWVIEPTFGIKYDVFPYIGCVHAHTHICKIRNAHQLTF